MQTASIAPTPPVPAPPARSPGQVFAAAFAEAGKAAAVELPFTITAGFPGFSKRPRLAVRQLFKSAPSDAAAARYWYETHPAASAAPVREQALRPEAGFEFRFDRVAIEPTTAWVQVPPALLDDPTELASFIDFRLLVRLATAENQMLTLGKRGLLEAPGVRRLPALADPISSLLAACDHVELMGGSADGAIMSTTDYYRYLVPRQDILASLAQLGIRVARTRMVPQGTVIVGDFLAGATIYDRGRSTLAFAPPPDGTFAQGGLALRAEVYTALAVHLPTHFFVAALV